MHCTRRLSLSLSLLLALAAPAAAQTAPAPSGPVLTLEEAVALAQRHNPVHQQVVNNRRAAAAGVRSAYGAFVPSVSAGFGSRFQEGGNQFFQGAQLGASSDIISSDYGVDVTLRLNYATLVNPRAQAANLDAVEADIDGSAAALEADVTRQYIAVLQSQASAELQDTLVVSARQQLELAQARHAAGAATLLDVRRAEVTLGQQEVAALRAHNQIAVDRLRLFQLMGVPQPEGVVLTSEFSVASAPPISLDSALTLARRENPGLTALRSRARAADVNVKRARSEYSPTLTLSTGWSGYTSQYTDADGFVEAQRQSRLRTRASCLRTEEVRQALGLANQYDQCLAIDFTDSDARFLRELNSQYPFEFTKSPWSLSARVSIPIYDGLGREQRVQEAAAARADAAYNVRARELALTADVTAAFLTLETAAKTVELQTVNAARAREELALAEARYRVGASSFLEVTEARAGYERAENERISAIYDYHRAFAALESAVGRPLR